MLAKPLATAGVPEAPAPRRAATGLASAGAPAAIMLVAVSLLALPSTILAFSSRLDLAQPGDGDGGGLTSFTPGQIDPWLARAIGARPPGNGPLFRFTPAGIAARPDRSVTVAVRVDPETARTIIVRAPARANVAGALPARVASAAYSLGAAHGYQVFLPGMSQLVATASASHDEMPDLSGFTLNDGDGGNARLNAQIRLAEKDRAGRAPRTLEGTGEQIVDLGGSYRLTHNIDVTAGLRYSQDRDRLKPLADGKQDDQAVFVGTRFHF